MLIRKFCSYSTSVTNDLLLIACLSFVHDGKQDRVAANSRDPWIRYFAYVDYDIELCIVCIPLFFCCVQKISCTQVFYALVAGMNYFVRRRRLVERGKVR